jgi:hypothetical protein
VDKTVPALLSEFGREIDVVPDGLAGLGGHAIELVGHGAQLGRPPVDVSEGLLDKLANPDQGEALNPTLGLRDDAFAEPLDELSPMLILRESRTSGHGVAGL